jgi:hypothetical protein
MLMARLREARTPQAEPVQEELPPEEPVAEEPEIEEEPENEEEVADPEAEVAESEPEDDLSVLSQLEEMSAEDLEALGEQLRTKVPKRFGQLTARAKSAEEKVQQLEAELAKSREAPQDPLDISAPVENNPFSDIDTIEGLVEQAKTFKQIEDWAEPLLDDNEHLGIDEHVEDASGNTVDDQDGQPLTRRKLKEYLRKARQARETFLPARRDELVATAQRQQIDAALTEKAKGEFEWYESTDSDTAKQFEIFLNSPEVKMVSERVPEVMPQMRYMLAHFVDSLAKQAQEPAVKKTVAPPLKPPSSPGSNTGQSAQGRAAGVKKQLKEANERFQESPDVNSFIALRTTQRLSKR